MNPWKVPCGSNSSALSYQPPMSSPGAACPARCRNGFSSISSFSPRKNAWFASNCCRIGPSSSSTSPYPNCRSFGSIAPCCASALAVANRGFASTAAATAPLVFKKLLRDCLIAFLLSSPAAHSLRKTFSPRTSPFNHTAPKFENSLRKYRDPKPQRSRCHNEKQQLSSQHTIPLTC